MSADADFADLPGVPLSGPQTVRQRDALFYVLAALNWHPAHLVNWLRAHHGIDPATVRRHPDTPDLVAALEALDAAQTAEALADLEARLEDIIRTEG